MMRMMEYLVKKEDIKISIEARNIILSGLRGDQESFYLGISDYIQDDRMSQDTFDNRLTWHFLTI